MIHNAIKPTVKTNGLKNSLMMTAPVGKGSMFQTLNLSEWITPQTEWRSFSRPPAGNAVARFKER